MTNIGVFKVYIENYLMYNPAINQSMMIMVWTNSIRDRSAFRGMRLFLQQQSMESL